MNIGTAVIKSVNTSRPQVSRTSTAQSVAASSDEYFSFSSDYASNSSASKTQLTAFRYATPPSRKLSPIPRETKDSEMTLPQRPAAVAPPPLNVRFNKITSIRQIPSETDAKAPEDLSPPTPGVDDSPYIRFAIDQLTRDEELAGRGRHGTMTSADYPVHRVVPDEGLGYYNAAPETRDITPPEVDQQQPPPRNPRRLSQRAPEPERLIAVDRAPAHCPEMGFLPIALRPMTLLTTIFTILLMIAALIFCYIWSLHHNGLWDYLNGYYEGRYFIFQYLPQLLGIIIIIWLFVIQSSIRRTLPFMQMSEEVPADRILQTMSLLPANFVLPDTTYFTHGEKTMGICELVFWLMRFTIPLLSCAFQTKVYTINGRETWRWVSVQGVIWTLVILYILLIIVLLLVMGRFKSSKSALCWDPVSIADLISIFQRSNILVDYDRSEISGSMKTHIPPRLLRLGYWKTSKSPDVFYGIGEENAPWRRYSADRKHHDEKHEDQTDTAPWDIEAQRYSNASSFVRNIHSPFVRYRWTPWFLRDSAIVAWIVIATVFSIAFVVVSFVNQAIRHGFRPMLPTLPDAGGFSSSNFLYSFIPALFGMFLFLAWQPIDVFFRASQPFASLSHPQGATADESMLLSYPTCMPIETTVLALVSRHYRVAYISFVSLFSAMIPVLAGGVFTAQYWPKDDQVRVTADMPAFYVLTVALAIYAFSFLIIWPTRRRYLPHKVHTIADYLSFLYQSELLRDATFRQPSSKADLVARLVTVPSEDLTGGARKAPRYAFGIYMGRDGREHLGIDRLQRPGSGEMLITSGTFKH